MNLPPELLDEIIGHLPLDEPQTLRNCSLVAKSWVYPTQKRLFATVRISSRDYHLWKDRISPAKIEPLHHVRSLTYILDTTARFRPPEYHIDSLSNYLPSFRQLKKLVLSSICLQSGIPQQLENFGPFQHKLSSLSLWSCHVSSGALVTIVNYFPNLVDLQLCVLTLKEDGEPIPPLSRPLRGRLDIQQFWNDDLSLLDHLSDPPPELDELVVFGYVRMPVAYDRVVTTYAGSVKRLELLRGFVPVNPPTLSHCQGLLELELCVVYPTQLAEILLTSITSMDLRKITLSMQLLNEILPYSDFVSFCNTADDPLCQLVDQLRESGYKRTLEVGLETWRLVEREEGLNFGELLPKFREKGSVRIESTEVDWEGNSLSRRVS